MEKAAIYRAMSAETALIGGILSVAVAGYLAFAGLQNDDYSAGLFACAWLVVLAITASASAVLIRRDALRRGEPFISPGLRSASRAMLPPLLTGAVVSALFVVVSFRFLPSFWMLFYGLALLATAHFAPPSIFRLGWAFVLAGLACLVMVVTRMVRILPDRELEPAIQMAVTFGLFHLIYAACTWPRKAKPAAEP